MAQLNSIRKISGQAFVLAEKLHDYRTACLAQAEYWAEGYCCRKVVVEDDWSGTGNPVQGYYEIWIGPERKRKIRTLPDEHITRERGARLWRVS